MRLFGILVLISILSGCAAAQRFHHAITDCPPTLIYPNTFGQLQVSASPAECAAP